MPEQSNDYRVVVFGAGGVGKSSLVLRFVKGEFSCDHIFNFLDQSIDQSIDRPKRISCINLRMLRTNKRLVACCEINQSIWRNKTQAWLVEKVGGKKSKQNFASKHILIQQTTQARPSKIKFSYNPIISKTGGLFFRSNRSNCRSIRCIQTHTHNPPNQSNLATGSGKKNLGLAGACSVHKSSR